MKAEVLAVGSYTEGTEGGVKIEGWSVTGEESREPLTLSDLKQIAIENGTYEQHEGTIVGDAAHGVRYSGDSPFGD